MKMYIYTGYMHKFKISKYHNEINPEMTEQYCIMPELKCYKYANNPEILLHNR